MRIKIVFYYQARACVATELKAKSLQAGVCSKVKVYLQCTKQGEQAAYTQKAYTPQWLLGKRF